MSNEKDNHLDDSTLDNYKFNIEEKKGFLSSIINIFKKGNQGLLNPGNTDKVHVTSRSISSMWGGASLRTKFFNTLENIRASIIKPKAPEVKNGFNTEIYSDSKNSQDLSRQEEQTPSQSQEKKYYRPLLDKMQKQNIIDNSKTAKDVLEETEELKEADSNSQKEQDSVEKTSNESDTKATHLDSSAVSQPTSTMTLGTISFSKQTEQNLNNSDKNKDDELDNR